MLGVAKDILEYSVAGSFDAVILGRRGLSGIAEYFAGSVSANIVNNSDFIPIWLVDEKALSKNIMVAVDGSESSLKTGSVSRYLLDHFTDGALWVVP